MTVVETNYLFAVSTCIMENNQAEKPCLVTR